MHDVEKDDETPDLPVPTGVAPPGRPDPVLSTAPQAAPSPHAAEDEAEVPDEDAAPAGFGYPVSSPQGTSGALPPPPVRPTQ